MMQKNAQRIHDLEQQIQELKGRWPKHSVQPWLLQELEELEDELAALKKQNEDNNADKP